MRKGVIDLWRTYQVGIAANHRSLDALTAAPLRGEGVAALDAYSCRPRDREEARRRCERTSRLIVKTRGHGLVAKIPRARRYRVTPYGQRVMTAAVALHDNRFDPPASGFAWSNQPGSMAQRSRAQTARCGRPSPAGSSAQNDVAQD